VQEIAHHLELTAQTVQLMPMQDALTSSPSLEEPADNTLHQLVNKFALEELHLNQSQLQLLSHQLNLNQL
jgi:hypothetical protein